jgi:hypothetical protein
MGKRIARIRHQDLSETALAPYIGEAVDVVLLDNSTQHGLLKAANDSSLVVEDSNKQWYNRRKHVHTFAYKDLREVAVAYWSEN